MYDFLKIMKRIISSIDDKIDEYIKIHSTKENKINKKIFLEQVGGVGGIVFPISKDTYYKYKKASKKNNKSDLHSMKIDTLYTLCNYTDVSADYFLGLIDTKRKEPSAPQVREDFGLSDKAMETLKIIKNNKPQFKGDLSFDLMNLVLENTEFWEKLHSRLPVYISSFYESRVDETDIDIARYGIIRAFEELLDDITDFNVSLNLPRKELDEFATFPSEKLDT